MAKLDFPASPTPNEIYTANGRSWIWNGISWKTYNALGTISISGGGTGLTFINSGDAFLSSNSAGTALTYRTFTAGSGILITVNPSNVVFTSTATGSGSGNVYDGIKGQLGYYFATGTAITGSGTGLTFDLPTNSLYITGNLSLNGTVINGTWAGTALTSKYGGFGSIPTVSKGDILVGSGNTWYNLPYSASDNQVLTVDTAQPFGLKWANVPPAAASSVAVKPTNDTGTRYLLFVNTSDASGLALSTDTNLTYDASNNLLSLGILSGTAISITNGSNFSAFIYSGSSQTTYTLPSSTPATGTSVLQSTSAGVMSWVAMAASSSGSATTANNIDLVSAGGANTAFYIPFSRTITGSGVALSSDSTVSFNASTSILSVSGLAVTASTGGTNSTQGALVVTGGVGIGGSLYVGGAGNTGLILGPLPGGGYAAIWSQNSAVSTSNYALVTNGNASLLNGVSGAHISIGAQQKLSVDASTITIQPTTGSATTGTGAFYVKGTAAFAQTVNIGGRLFLFSSANGTNSVGFLYSGTANTVYTLPATSPATGTSILQSTSAGVLSWIPNVPGTATTANNINLVLTSQNTNHYLTFSNASSGSGVALSSDTDLTYNPSSNLLSLGTGSLAANGVTVGSSSNTITTSSGNLILNGATGNVQISGNLIVNGDTVSIGSTISTLLDPIFVLGAGIAGTNPTVDDNKDRGIEFRWYSGTAKTGFFGFDDSTGYFTFIPDGLNNNEVFSGTAGTALFTTVISDLTGTATTSNYAHQSGYAITSGTATTSNYSHQSGYAITSGLATTTDNIKLIFASTSANHPLIFTPNSSSSGSALSTNSTLVYNPSTDILYSSGISVTSTTASTSITTGALTISGGAGIGGSLFVGGIGASVSGVKILNSVINAGVWAATAITSAYGGIGSIPIVSKGDILVGSGNTWYNLPYSASDNQVLTVDTAQPFGVKWASVPPAAASSVAVSPTNDTGNRYLTFVNSSSGSGLALSTDTDLYYSASNNLLSVGTLSGSGISIINGSNYSAFVYTGSATTTYRLPSSTPATGSSILQSDSTGLLSWVAPSAGSISGSGTSAYVPLWTSSGTALTNSIMSQSSTTIDVAGHLKARTKSFLIPHPLDPENMWLEHGSLEGPEHGVYVRGTASGIDEVTIYLPDYWDKLVDEEYTILITPKVPFTLYVSKQNRISFTIKRAKAWFSRKKNIEFDYIVVAPRNDIKLQLNQPR
jgi:hypothetical protein